jgi:hypothetical protein
MSEHVEQLNREVMLLDDSHPAKRFLNAFIDCRKTCAGLEIPYHDRQAIDQVWVSIVDGKRRTFSGFVYEYLCYDIVLDGFLQGAKQLTAAELVDCELVPRMRALVTECADEARKQANNAVAERADQILKLFDLWESYLDFRKAAIAKDVQ